jgi:hypothetical protein
VWHFIRTAEQLEKSGLPPVVGGWEDQCVQFQAAYSAWCEYEAQVQKILRDRDNG